MSLCIFKQNYTHWIVCKCFRFGLFAKRRHCGNPLLNFLFQQSVATLTKPKIRGHISHETRLFRCSWYLHLQLNVWNLLAYLVSFSFLGLWNLCIIWCITFNRKHLGKPKHLALFFFTAKSPTAVNVLALHCSLFPCSSPSLHHSPLLPPHSWNPAFLFCCCLVHLSQSYSTTTLRRRLLPSCSLALSLVRKIIETHLQSCWSWPDLRTHTVCLSLEKRGREREKERARERENKMRNISDRTTADCEGEKKGSWKTVGWEEEAEQLHILHHKQRSTFSSF